MRSYDRSGPQPLPKRLFQRVRSSAPSFNFQCSFLLLKSSSSCFRLLTRLFVPYIFHSIACFRRHFLRKMWPIQLAFFRCILCKMFLSSLILCNTSLFFTRSLQMSFCILLQHHISKLSRHFRSTFRRVQVTAPSKAALQMCILYKSRRWNKTIWKLDWVSDLVLLYRHSVGCPQKKSLAVFLLGYKSCLPKIYRHLMLCRYIA